MRGGGLESSRAGIDETGEEGAAGVHSTGNRCVWLPGGAHTRFQTCREVPARP
jgi:hypothetical protein